MSDRRLLLPYRDAYYLSEEIEDYVSILVPDFDQGAGQRLDIRIQDLPQVIAALQLVYTSHFPGENARG